MKSQEFYSPAQEAMYSGENPPISSEIYSQREILGNILENVFGLHPDYDSCSVQPERYVLENENQDDLVLMVPERGPSTIKAVGEDEDSPTEVVAEFDEIGHLASEVFSALDLAYEGGEVDLVGISDAALNRNNGEDCELELPEIF